MAEVFRATLVGAEGFSRAVAIKRILPGYSADPLFAEMFVAEARIASLLTHPNVVPVIDFDRDDQGRLFLVMELVEGVDLHKLAANGPLPLGVTAQIIADLLRALAYAHEVDYEGRPARIVHRDVSPHNVLISKDGTVKLSDFGIAKAAEASPVTRTGIVKGKASYMSPEQARAEVLDARSDLFAVGIILHELLLSRRLFAVKTGAPDAVIMHRVLQMAVPPIRADRPEVSESLANVCMKLLQRNKVDRFQSAQDALDALIACPELTTTSPRELTTFINVRARAAHTPATTPKGGFTESRTDEPTSPSLDATVSASFTVPSPSIDADTRPDRPSLADDSKTKIIHEERALASPPPAPHQRSYLVAIGLLAAIAAGLTWELSQTASNEDAQLTTVESVRGANTPEPPVTPEIPPPSDAGRSVDARPAVVPTTKPRDRKQRPIRRTPKPPKITEPRDAGVQPRVAPRSKSKLGDDILAPTL